MSAVRKRAHTDDAREHWSARYARPLDEKPHLRLTMGTHDDNASSAADAAGSIRDAAGGRTRVVILNQYYVPDVASTGHLLHELSVELARHGMDVRVLTSRPSYGPPETWQDCPLRETVHGVNIHRMWTTRFSKDNLLGRGINYLTFIVQLALRVLFTSRKDTIYLYTTNPPFLGFIGALVSMVRKHTYVMLLHDAYPQLPVKIGKFSEDSLITKIWHRVNRISYGRAKHAIVLCQAAKRLVADTYHMSPERIHVIPNWADGLVLRKKAKQDSRFAAKHNLLNHFTLLYSGNLGLYYDFDTVLDAAELLKDEPFKLVLIGSGGKKRWLQSEIERRGLTNAHMLPYQPFEELPDSLAACDASLVSIAEGIEGISFPSKLYSSLATGKPIVALSEDWSELRRVVEENDCGVWAEVGDGEGLANGIRTLMADHAEADQKGDRARALFEREYTRESCCARYAEVLRLAARELPVGATAQAAAGA